MDIFYTIWIFPYLNCRVLQIGLFPNAKKCQIILGCEDNGKDLGGLLLPLVSMAIGYRCMFVAKII